MVNGREFSTPAAAPDFTLDQVFVRFDNDGNGLWENSEYFGECSRKFDIDQNGSVSRFEFAVSAEKLAGSQEAFLQMVKDRGGLDGFYVAAKSGLLDRVSDVSLSSVFAWLDRNGNGILEKAECICPGTRASDMNNDGFVTRGELTTTAVMFFGSEKAFLDVIRQKGGVEAFYSPDGENAFVAWSSRLEVVFRQYDRDHSGVLEPAECICRGTKMADANGDGIVTVAEREKLPAPCSVRWKNMKSMSLCSAAPRNTTSRFGR